VTTAGFGGHEWDSATDLSLTRYRAYAPEVARWLSEDPIGIDGGLNLYRYADGEPMGHADPTGLVSVQISEPSIIYRPRSEIGGCGNLRYQPDLSGVCKCDGGSWRASLTIGLIGLITVANDTWVTPQSLIIWHEQRHWGFKVEAVNRAKAAGERVEAKPYESESACEAAISAWKSEWYSEIDKAGDHTFWTNEAWRRTCL
jgi:RHS repeat-associated protein